MEDNLIVALYWKRDEAALKETAQKYERYLTTIAYNILCDREDSKESVNDTYLKAWNSMPPNRPFSLSTYLGKITRQLSVDRFRTKNRKKRRASQYALALSELSDCISKGDETKDTVEARLLAAAIEAYLSTLSDEARNLFLGRYYFLIHCGTWRPTVKSASQKPKVYCTGPVRGFGCICKKRDGCYEKRGPDRRAVSH